MFLMSTKMCIISCSAFIDGYYAGTKTTATSLAKRFGLNIRTLNPSLNKLIQAGILRSQVGGVDRGYIFTRDPKEITLCDIIEAIEGFSDTHKRRDELRDVLSSIDKSVDEKLAETTERVDNYAREQYKQISVYDLFRKE